jgi:hypothetical protein
MEETAVPFLPHHIDNVLEEWKPVKDYVSNALSDQIIH